MISKQHIPWFVGGLFLFIALAVFITKRREYKMADMIRLLQSSQIKNLMFYKDAIRDSEPLDLNVTDQKTISTFVESIRDISESNVSLRSLKYKQTVKIHLIIKEQNLNVDSQSNDKRRQSKDLDDFLNAVDLELKIIMAERYPKNVFISMAVLDGFGEWPAGLYSSIKMKAWIDTIQKQPEYSAVAESY